MSPTPLEQRIRKTYDKARTVWAIMLIAAIGGTLAYLPWWCLVLIIPFAFITYYATLLILAIIIADSVDEKEMAELQARDAAQTAAENAAAKEIPEDATDEERKLASSPQHDIAVVEEMGPVIGAYMDKPIHAFVLIKAPNEKEVSKFDYHGPADVKNGMPVIPTFDDMLFACIGGILYSKTIQPA